MIIDIRNLIGARRDEQNDEGGFTLIELLIVIVVLGILAAIVVFAVQNVAGDSAKSACKTDAKTVEVAQEAYKAKNGTYAASVDALITTAGGGPYLKSKPGNINRYVITTGSADGKVLVAAPPTAGALDHNSATHPCDSIT